MLEYLRTSDPVSQAALARGLGLSPATVSSLIQELRGQGLVELRQLNGRESQVALAEPDTAVVAVEVTGRAIHAALFDFGRSRRLDQTVRFDDASPGGGPDLLVELIRSVAARSGIHATELTGVAVGIQSPVDPDSGTIASWAHNHLAGWLGIPIAATLQELIGAPVITENDANLAALAEWTWGVGRRSHDFLYLMCSSGVGGGLILDGSIYHGNAGLAGEIGHFVIEPNGPVCFCGSRGCLTTYVSERSILLALETSGSPQHSLREVIDSARAGDPASRAVLWETGRYLGRAVFGTTKIIAPSVVAVGGTLSRAGSLVFDSLTSSVEANSLRGVASTSRIEAAQLTTDATILGGVAALLARDDRGLSTLPDWVTPSATAPSPA